MGPCHSTPAGTSGVQFDAKNARMSAHNVGCGNIVGSHNRVETHIHNAATRDEMWNKVMEWLHKLSIDFLPIHEEVLSRRALGTGRWFLTSDKYQRWVDGGEQNFECTGIPGAGKTTLTSAIIEDLRERCRSHPTALLVLYTYCRHDTQSSQTIPLILFSLLTQAVERKGQISPDVLDLHKEYSLRPERFPGKNRITSVLRSEITTFRRTYIVVDALDEYHVKDYASSQELVEQLQQLKVHLLITSRHKVRFALNARFVTTQVSAHAEDIQKYIISQRGNLADVAGRFEGLLAEIIGVITEKSGGMFMIAKLLIDCISHALTPKEIREDLEKLPTGLVDTHKLTMHRIGLQEERLSRLALQAFAWVLFSKRHLSPVELIHAVSFKQGENITRCGLIGEETLLSACGGLISFVGGAGISDTRICQFSHSTTKEFLLLHWKEYLPDAEHLITKTCLGYLAMAIADFPLNFFVGDSERVEMDVTASRFEELPLCKYALSHWMQHAEGLGQTLDDMSVTDFSKHAFSLYLADEWRISIAGAGTRARFRAIFGAFHWLEELPVDNAEELGGASITDGHHMSTHIMHHTAIDVLLNTNSNLLPDNTTQTHSVCAASRSIVDILKIQLDQGLGRTHTELTHTPFAFAVNHGCCGLVETMFNIRGIGPEDVLCNGRPLLTFAAETGRLDMVNMLLNRGAKIHSAHALGRTALHIAAKAGNPEMVNNLLSLGATLDLQDELGRTSLSLASEAGHLEVVKLCARETNLDIQDDLGRSPLSLAAEAGHLEVVKELLQRGANINSQLGWGRTPLSFAAKEGNLSVVKVLLELGAEINSRNHRGRTPLAFATEAGRSDVVEILLECGADLNTQDYQGRTPLHCAVKEGHSDIVNKLLERGAT